MGSRKRGRVRIGKGRSSTKGETITAVEMQKVARIMAKEGNGEGKDLVVPRCRRIIKLINSKNQEEPRDCQLKNTH